VNSFFICEFQKYPGYLQRTEFSVVPLKLHLLVERREVWVYATMSEKEAAVVTFLIGLLLCLGIFASYVPQHVECMLLRSADGLSIGTILISSVSCTAATLASLLGDWHAIRTTVVPRGDVGFFVRFLQTVNVCMPTFQNLMTVVVGTPTYAIYYFGFARPENINDAYRYYVALCIISSFW
jgi:PQ loop repeat